LSARGALQTFAALPLTLPAPSAVLGARFLAAAAVVAAVAARSTHAGVRAPLTQAPGAMTPAPPLAGLAIVPWEAGDACAPVTAALPAPGPAPIVATIPEETGFACD
jgi:hypothetical protein